MGAFRWEPRVFAELFSKILQKKERPTRGGGAGACLCFATTTALARHWDLAHPPLPHGTQEVCSHNKGARCKVEIDARRQDDHTDARFRLPSYIKRGSHTSCEPRKGGSGHVGTCFCVMHWALIARPTPSAAQGAGTGGKCSTCNDSGRVATPTPIAVMVSV